MKGRTSMNPIMLEVRLYAETEDDDILSFMFEDGEEKIYMNSDSCQGQMKEVFSKLITLSLRNDVKLKFVIDDEFGRGLYKDVCAEYVQELQRELDGVKDRIRREITL